MTRLIGDHGVLGRLLHAVDTIHRAIGRRFLPRRQAGILRELCRGGTWIGAMIEHGQTVPAVALRKMVESPYSLDGPQA